MALLGLAVFCVYRSGHNHDHYMAFIHYPAFAQDNPYFFDLFLEDFEQSRPPVFVDAEDPIYKAKLDDHPELAGRIARDYEQVAIVGETRI